MHQVHFHHELPQVSKLRQLGEQTKRAYVLGATRVSEQWTRSFRPEGPVLNAHPPGSIFLLGTCL